MRIKCELITSDVTVGSSITPGRDSVFTLKMSNCEHNKTKKREIRFNKNRK